MLREIPKIRGQFSKLRAARELLREKSEEILRLYLENIQKAQEAEDFETADKALRWLLEHMPADEDGGRIVDQSVDKQQIAAQKDTGPRIQIGIAVGGTSNKQLPPAEIIDIE